NKLGDAEVTLRKAVQRESHDATIHQHLGDVYAKSGRNDLAAAEWEKSLAEWKRSLPADLETDKVARSRRSSRKPSIAWRKRTPPANSSPDPSNARNSRSSLRESQPPPRNSGQAERWLPRTAHHFPDHLAPR